MMKIAENKVVSLSYELKENDANGTILEVTDDSRPLKFVYGSGMLLPDFETNIEGLAVGEAFNFTLTPEQAYGPVNNQAIVNLSKEIFTINGVLRSDLLEIGNVIPMRNNDGVPLNGKVMKVNEADVTLDFNHPMAGKTLYFSGNVLEVREATAEEIMNGMPEGMGGGCGCGCGGDDCGDGCGEGCGDDSGSCGSGCGCK